MACNSIVVLMLLSAAFQGSFALECHNCWWFENTPPPTYPNTAACRNDPKSLSTSLAPSDHVCIILTTENVTMFKHDNTIFYQGALTWRASFSKTALGGGSRSECDRAIPPTIVEALEKMGNYRNAHWLNSKFCQCTEEDGCNSASGMAISAAFVLAMATLAKLLAF